MRIGFCFVLLLLSIALNDVCAFVQRHAFVTGKSQIIARNRRTTSVSVPESGRIREVDTAMVPWYQDDLPNILGINPLEAAVIFGALYYFYGPTVLFDYTREAGKFFSTYAPVVKEITTDIFYEFRDYFDESKEREELEQAGIDVEAMPRRTTNIIERFQESLDSFSEVTDAGDAAGAAAVPRREAAELLAVAGGMNKLEVVEEEEDGDSGGHLSDPAKKKKKKTKKNLDGEGIEDSGADEKKRTRRRSKREVLEAQNIDVAQVMESTAMQENDTGLTESVRSVQQSVAALEERGAAQKAATAPRNPGDAIAQSKFSQQMNGEWNQKVLRRDKYGSPIDAVPPAGLADMGAIANTPISELSDISDTGTDTGTPFGFDEFNDPGSPYNGPFPLPGEASAQAWETDPEKLPLDPAWGGDVPTDLAAAPAGVGDVTVYTGNGKDSIPAAAAIDVLKALDQDYAKLRQRFVALLPEEEQIRMMQEQQQAMIELQGSQQQQQKLVSAGTSQGQGVSISEQIAERNRLDAIKKAEAIKGGVGVAGDDDSGQLPAPTSDIAEKSDS